MIVALAMLGLTAWAAWPLKTWRFCAVMVLASSLPYALMA